MENPTNPAVKLLQDFLDEHNIGISLATPVTKLMEGGGMVIEPPQIQVFFKEKVKEEVTNAATN